ncbi:MAG: response regulator transcription factor [Bacteroidetes bacterium]|nr:response regulator transcription factor [Bacteroidota bacterium]
MKITCIAIDDEPLALQKMHDYILRVGYLDLLAEFDNALEALEFLKSNKVDLVFLDIQMEELTGIQMIEAMKDKPKVILTTAYHEYAIKGYELDICDYLLKPIPFSRFLQSCEKIHSMLDSESDKEYKPIMAGEKSVTDEFFFLKNGSITQNVKFDDILFVEGMKDYLRVHTFTDKIMTLLSFKKLEQTLTYPRFVRIHKSYLVAVDKITSIERNRVTIGKEILPIGESYRRQFFKVIDDKKL